MEQFQLFGRNWWYKKGEGLRCIGIFVAQDGKVSFQYLGSKHPQSDYSGEVYMRRNVPPRSGIRPSVHAPLLSHGGGIVFSKTKGEYTLSTWERRDECSEDMVIEKEHWKSMIVFLERYIKQ